MCVCVGDEGWWGGGGGGLCKNRMRTFYFLCIAASHVAQVHYFFLCISYILLYILEHITFDIF